MKKICLLVLLFAFTVLCGTHHDFRGTQVHTPFRWIFADSTARADEAVAAADTHSVAFVLSDTSQWILLDNSPKTWVKLSVQDDSLNYNMYIDSIKSSFIEATKVDINGGAMDGVIIGAASAQDADFDSVDANVGVFDSISTGGTWFQYDTGSFLCTLNVALSAARTDGVDSVGVGKWSRIGSIINVIVDDVNISYGSLGAIKIDNFPDSLLPTVESHCPVGVRGASANMCVYFKIGTTDVYILSTYNTGAHVALILNPTFTYSLR